jgi:hypothetical protein
VNASCTNSENTARRCAANPPAARRRHGAPRQRHGARRQAGRGGEGTSGLRFDITTARPPVADGP